MNNRTTLTAQFGRHRLADVLVALNRACVAWSRGELKTRMPALRDLEPKHPMFDFAAGETARLALLHCMEPAYATTIVLTPPKLDWPALEHLIDGAVAAHLDGQAGADADWERRVHEQPPHNTFGPIWLPQFMLQRRSAFRIGQTLLLYGDAARERADRDPAWPKAAFDEALRLALGVEPEAFLAALIQLAGRAVAEAQLSALKLTPTNRSGYDAIVLEETRAGVLMPSAHASVIDRLSGRPTELNDWSARQLERKAGSASATPERGPNPLLRYPLVQCFPDKSDFCVAPVPSRILEWLYEPLVNEVFDRLDDAFTPAHLSALFEEYVGLLARRCSPSGTRWVPESDLLATLAPGRRVVDWAFMGTDLALLVDAKRCYVHPAARYRWLEQDWANARKEIAKGVRQAADFWQSVQQGLAPQLGVDTGREAFAVIVTQGDASFHATRPDWRTDIEREVPPGTQIPWVVLSLDDYELLMSAWWGRDESWLRDALRRVAEGETVRDVAGGLVDERSPLLAASLNFIDGLRTSMLDA